MTLDPMGGTRRLPAPEGRLNVWGAMDFRIADTFTESLARLVRLGSLNSLAICCGDAHHLLH
jgi:hypothetical protein